MNKTWREFVLAHNPAFYNKPVVPVEHHDPTSRDFNEDMLCDLSHRGLIAISGDDAVSFMQGQFTTNVPDVSLSCSQRSAWCTPKGRVIAIFTILARDDGFLLMLPSELKSNVIKRLGLYVLRSRVTVIDVTHGDLVCIGCQGEKAETLLKKFYHQLPSTTYQTAQSPDGVSAVRVPGLCPRYEIFGPTNAMIVIWKALAKHIHSFREPAWSLGDILAGVPTIRNETSDEYLPQMLNLELTGSVNFNKGCYAGQEIVARAHYLGKIKRRMYLGGVRAQSSPPLGAALIDGKSQQTLGKIVDVIQNGDTDYITLAVAKVESHASDEIHLESTTGPKISLRAFPYMEETG